MYRAAVDGLKGDAAAIISFPAALYRKAFPPQPTPEERRLQAVRYLKATEALNAAKDNK